MTRYTGGAVTISGGGGPNPTDSFSIATRIADLSPIHSDAVSFSFLFPETFLTPTDLLKLSLINPDTSPSLSDSFPALTIRSSESSLSPTDTLTHFLNLALSDSNLSPTDLLKIAFTFPDTNSSLSDTRTSLAKVWASGSAGTGVATPSNADGPNNSTNAVVSTAVASPATETMTSSCGSVISAGLTFSTVTFRGWYRLQTTLSSSTAVIIVRSSSALFTDITIETLSAINGDTNRLTTPFSVDLSATINTLAKLQSAQFISQTTDAAAGVSPAITTVDALSLELTGVL